MADVLAALARHLQAQGIDATRLVSLTAFSAPADIAAARAALATTTGSLVGEPGLPVSVLAQPPAPCPRQAALSQPVRRAR